MTGRPARGVANRVMREVGPISPDAPAFPHAATALGPLKAAAEKLGKVDFTNLWAGQSGADGPRDAGGGTDALHSRAPRWRGWATLGAVAWPFAARPGINALSARGSRPRDRARRRHRAGPAARTPGNAGASRQ